MAEQQPSVQQQVLSAGVFQFAEAQQIGTVVKVYTSSALKKSLLGISLSVLGGAFILAGVAAAALTHTLSSIRVGIYAVIFGLAFLGFGLSQIRAASRNKRAQIHLGTDGLIVKGNQAEAIRWDQLAAVQKIFTQLQNNYFLRAYVLYRLDGSALALEKSYRDFKELGKAIEEEVTRRLLPGAIAAYDAGNPVSFGAIQVSLQGISVQQQKGPKTLAWDDFERIKVYDGRVRIKKRNARLTWETLLIPQVPNLCVLLALTEYITGGQTPQH